MIRIFRNAFAGAGVPALLLLGAACTGGQEEASLADAEPEAATVAAVPAEQVGVQLYTLRDLTERDLAATLQQVAAAGYGEVEFAGYFNHSPEEVRAMLDRDGLTSPAVHVPIEALRADAEGAFDAARTIGHQWVVVPYLTEDQRTPEGYRQLAADLNRFGAMARERGLRLAYHNHDFEFANMVDGRPAYEFLLDETDPALVDMELDLFWATKAGRDPVALFAEHPGRFPLWHIKDMADIGGTDRMVAVGEGDIDFRRIFAQREQAGLRHFFVEHDNPEDALVSVQTSYRNLRQMLP